MLTNILFFLGPWEATFPSYFWPMDHEQKWYAPFLGRGSGRPLQPLSSNLPLSSWPGNHGLKLWSHRIKAAWLLSHKLEGSCPGKLQFSWDSATVRRKTLDRLFLREEGSFLYSSIIHFIIFLYFQNLLGNAKMVHVSFLVPKLG